MMQRVLMNELMKNGYSETNGNRVWNISNRSFRYINPDMAKAFLKLREHPRYREIILGTEIELLKKHVSDFLACENDCAYNFIDLGCTTGEKAIEILKKLSKDMKVRYCPVSVNSYFVNLSLEEVKKANLPNVIDYAPRIVRNFESLDEIGAALRNNKYQKNICIILGSLISSFEINDYLFRLSQSMFKGDLLLIGNGIRTGPRFANLETYKNPIFNTWLIYLMKELGFQDTEVELNARFANERLEFSYTIKEDKELKHSDKTIHFKKGDEILVLIQYKLFKHELEDFCKMYFDEVKLVQDPKEEYALVLCKK